MESQHSSPLGFNRIDAGAASKYRRLCSTSNETIMHVTIVALNSTCVANLRRSYQEWLLAIAMTFGAIVVTTESYAAEIFYGRQQNATWATIYIIGPIEIGDERKFTAAVKGAIQRASHIGYVSLASRGGRIEPALDIGRQIRALGISTYAPVHDPTNPDMNICGSPIVRDGHVVEYRSISFHRRTGRGDQNCVCHSACALIWSAGVGRDGDSVGFHRPYFDPSEYAGLSVSDARRQYNNMVQEVREYLSEMGVDNNIIAKMMAASSENIAMLTSGERSILASEPYLEELKLARCGSWEKLQREMEDAAQRNQWSRVQSLHAAFDEVSKCTSRVDEELFKQNLQAYLQRY